MGLLVKQKSFVSESLICIIEIVSDNKKNAPTNIVKNTQYYINHHIEKY